MSFLNYLKDRIMLLLLQAVCMGGSYFYLSVCGVSRSQLILYLAAWAGVLSGVLLTGWLGRRRYFTETIKALQLLDKPYLLGEVMPLSHRQEDKCYRELIRLSNKSVIDEVHRLENKQTQYREFIENWIHEVKLPITTMQLICENRNSWEGEVQKQTRRLLAQLSLLESGVEKALYYARSDYVAQDYRIRELSLRDTCVEAVKRNAPYLRQRGALVEVRLEEEKVYCDDKWLEFIIGQLLINSAKYGKEGGCRIQIWADVKEGGTSLFVEDDGLGIPGAELGRIFHKGFTGSNGRGTRQSTGMGLYLCDKLCKKLGISIHAASREGVYTRMQLYFPDGSSHFALKDKR